MPTYKITDPKTGKSFEVTGESEPSEKEIGEILEELGRARFNTQEKQVTQNVTSNDEKKSEKVEKSDAQGPTELKGDETNKELTENASIPDTFQETPAEVSPDVQLQVPTLEIDELKLLLQGLTARVSLSAQLANLIRLDVGAHADIEKLDLDMKGVNAKAVLNVHLKEVNSIFSRALQTLDKHPEILATIPSEAIPQGGRQRIKSGEPGTNSIKDVPNISENSLNAGLPHNQQAVLTNEPVLTTDGINIDKGISDDSIQEVHQNLDHSITGNFDETEEERRYFFRKDKDQSPS
ncbi:MAG: hypothetical protein GX640_06885 [Fibrobacter sp.]|nr:hypothetical protein [Fibrobacter sp.]